MTGPTYTPPAFGAPVRVIPSESHRNLFASETRVPGLSYGVVCVILRLAVFVELWPVTDRQTDGQTRDDMKYRASIESRE